MDEEALAPSHEEANIETPNAAVANPNIIVVDDEVPIAYMLSDILTDEGYGVEVYHDGASALQAIIERPPRLMLLDMAMPIMSGEELLANVRDLGLYKIPIIMMSASPHIGECIRKGANAIIPKPFELNQLLLCVNKFYTLKTV